MAARTLLLLALLLLAPALGAEDERRRPLGTLRVGVAAKIDGLDPTQQQTESSRLCIWNVYDQLYEYEYLKRPYALKPCLAEAMPEVSEDRLTYTMRLAAGVTYVDDPCFPNEKGRALHARDVVFCLKRLMDARVASPYRWAFEGRIVGLDAFTEASAGVEPDPHRAAYTTEEGYPEVAGLVPVDERTLRITLTKPWPQLTWMLASVYGSVYAPEAVKRYGAEFGRHAVGTGPYVVQTFAPEQMLILKRREGYREDRFPSAGAPGDAKAGMLADAGRLLPLNSMVLVTVHDSPLTVWNQFHEGNLDRTLVPGAAFGSIVDPRSGALLPALKERGLRLHADPKLEIIYTAFNMNDEVFGHPAGEKGRAIRRAICLASDDDYVVENVYNNLAERVYGPILKDFAEYDERFVNPWARQADESYEAALELAREELAEAGLADGKGIPELEREVLNDESSRRVFTIFQRNLAKLGIRVRANYVTWAESRKRIDEGKARMWSISWEADYPDAENFLQLFYGRSPPAMNSSRYDNPEFNALYEEALLLPVGSDREALYRDMQELVVDDCPWHFGYRRLQHRASQPWLHNYRHNEIGERYFKYCRIDTGMRNRMGK